MSKHQKMDIPQHTHMIWAFLRTEYLNISKNIHGGFMITAPLKTQIPLNAQREAKTDLFD